MAKIINRLAEIKKQKEEAENIALSWEKVAADTGMGYSTILRWANDHVDRYDRKSLLKFCDYFKCQPGDILKYKED